jgi:hypothetical protein
MADGDCRRRCRRRCCRRRRRRDCDCFLLTRTCAEGDEIIYDSERHAKNVSRLCKKQGPTDAVRQPCRAGSMSIVLL